jgi:hypothetical protein
MHRDVNDFPAPGSGPRPAPEYAPPPADIPVATLDTALPVRRGRRGPRVIVFTAGVVALALVGALVARSASGSTGATSAQAAVNRAINAISNEDPVALASLLAPDELHDVTGIMKTASQKGKSFNLTESMAHPFAGINLNIVDPQTHIVTLADGYAKVELTGGTFTYDIDPAKLAPTLKKDLSPDTKLHGSYDLGRFSCASLASENQGMVTDDLPVYCKDGGLGPFLIEVRENGHWYISPIYTGLEYWRIAADLPVAEFGSNASAPHAGSSSPQDAVLAMANALGSINVDQMLALLPPGEFRALYDYRAAIHAALEKSDAPSFLFSVNSDASLRVENTNGGKKVVVESASGQYNADPDNNSPQRLPWQLNGVCMTSTDADGATHHDCASDTHESYGSGSFNFHLDAFFVDTVQHNGKWYVSPSLTIADYARVVINALKPPTV